MDLAHVAPLYRALAAPEVELIPAGYSAVVVERRRGFTPAEVDEMELWLIADFLGIGREAEAGAPVSEAEWRAQAAALNAARIDHDRAVAAAREAGEEPPPPLAAPPSATPQVTDDMIRALRERRQQRDAAKAARGA